MPQSLPSDGTASLTITGLGFHKEGEADPGPWVDPITNEKVGPLLNTKVLLSIGPSVYSQNHDARHVFTEAPLSDGTPQYRYYQGLGVSNTFWPQRVTFYPTFTVGAPITTKGDTEGHRQIVISLASVTMPVATANSTVEVAVTANRQDSIISTKAAFFSSASFHSLSPASNQYVVRPGVNTWRPLRADGVLIPRSEKVTVCVHGAGVVDTGLIAVKMVSTHDSNTGVPMNTVVGEANGTFMSSTEFCFETPGLDYAFKAEDYPTQVCQSQATESCPCLNWKDKRPDWGFDNACCMQPSERPENGAWCFCQSNIEFANDLGGTTGKMQGTKEFAPVKAICDLKYAPTMTYNTQLLIVLDKNYGDYIPHPWYLYHYETPKVLAVSPKTVSFSQYTNVTLFTDGFIDSSALQGRVFIGSSQSSVAVDVYYHSPVMLTVTVPPCPVGNTDVIAKFEFTLNGQEWHQAGQYNYSIPEFKSVHPRNLERSGGVLVTVFGGGFMNTSLIAVRLNTANSLNLEMQRFQSEKTRLSVLLVEAENQEAGFRNAPLDNVWDASERRLEELDAYEHKKVLELAVADIQAKIDQTSVCLTQATYIVPATFISKRQIQFIAPIMCVPDVHLHITADITHNSPIGEAGYHLDVLPLSTYHRMRVTSGDPPALLLNRLKTRTERGIAEVGSFEQVSSRHTQHDSLSESPILTGSNHNNLNRQYLAVDSPYTQVCKYLYTDTLHNYARDRHIHAGTTQSTPDVKDRWNGKGSVDSDPHLQVPPQMHHQLRREDYHTKARGDAPDEHSVFSGGQQQLKGQDAITRRLGEPPMPREIEKQCVATGQCTVFQDAWQKDWNLPNMTYEVVHCYKIMREPLISGGKTDGVLKKYNSSGHFIWEVRMGGLEKDELTAVTTDRWGNLFATGHFFSANISFDSKVLKQAVDTRSVIHFDLLKFTQRSLNVRKMLLTKYNSAGKFIMSAEIGSCWKDTCQIRSIDADDFGNMFVTGTFSGATTFGSMCESAQCKSVTQSDTKHKTVMKTSVMDAACSPSFTPTCKKTPVVKMTSVQTCRKSGDKKKGCPGNVFVAMFNAGGTLVWAANMNTRNVFKMQSNIPEVEDAVFEAWMNRAHWAYFDSGTLRLGTKFAHVSTSFWPAGGLYSQEDSTRYWWRSVNASQPVVPGLGVLNEFGQVCSEHEGKCEGRVHASSNIGGNEWNRDNIAFGDSVPRSRV